MLDSIKEWFSEKPHFIIVCLLYVIGALLIFQNCVQRIKHFHEYEGIVVAGAALLLDFYWKAVLFE